MNEYYDTVNSTKTKKRDGRSKLDKLVFCIARHAFANTLKDVRALQAMKKVRAISEISEGDERQVRENVAKEVVATIEKETRKINAGKTALNAKEFNEWCATI